ncbi:MAG TPA: Arc family DNA-binding protein [Longimicrobiaceae bacterium]|nr:Arc family DNA-binding protein [Longimicrobiaceae bacterium]
MTSFTIKNIPDDLYAELKRQAEANRRSLNGEIIHSLERVVREARAGYDRPTLDDLRALRARISAPPLTDDLLEDAIDRGRP